MRLSKLGHVINCGIVRFKGLRDDLFCLFYVS